MLSIRKILMLRYLKCFFSFSWLKIFQFDELERRRKKNFHHEWKTSSIFPLSSPSNAIFHSRRNKQQQKILFNNSFLLLFSWKGEREMLMHMCARYIHNFSTIHIHNDEWQCECIWENETETFFIIALHWSDDCWAVKWWQLRLRDGKWNSVMKKNLETKFLH